MSIEYLNLALVQMTSVDSLASNLHSFESIFTSLKPNQIDLLCFPENCLFQRIREIDLIEKFDLSHSCIMWLGDWAKRLNTTIHLGSVPLMIQEKLFNSTVWISDKGVPQVGYQKIHLFDIELEGQKPIKESSFFTSGQVGRIIDFNGWRIGESICYDLRFSELYSQYAKENVDLILVPASFLVETGRAHWEILLRARAIESQCYVAASAQVGCHRSTRGAFERKTYGHSLIVNPWGVVEMDLQESTGVQILQLRRDKIQKVRTQIPMKNHRKIGR